MTSPLQGLLLTLIPNLSLVQLHFRCLWHALFTVLLACA